MRLFRLITLILCTSVIAKETEYKKLPQIAMQKEDFYVFAISLINNNFSSTKNEHESKGLSSKLQLAKLYSINNFFILPSLDLHIGPFKAINKEKILLNNKSFGVSIWVGYNYFNPNNIQQNYNYGFGVGINYFDNKADYIGVDKLNTNVVNSYKLNSSIITISPSLHLSKLKSLKINKENYDNRTLGWLIKLSINIPVVSRFNVNSTQTTPTDEKIDKKYSGILKGYSFKLTLSTIIGT